MTEASNRGMIKWAPYKSLIEQSTILAKMRYEKNKQPRPLISQDRAMEINEILTTYAKEEVDVRYFKDGYLYHLCGQIDTICALYQYIEILGKRITFKDLIELTRI